MENYWNFIRKGAPLLCRLLLFIVNNFLLVKTHRFSRVNDIAVTSAYWLVRTAVMFQGKSRTSFIHEKTKQILNSLRFYHVVYRKASEIKYVV